MKRAFAKCMMVLCALLPVVLSAQVPANDNCSTAVPALTMSATTVPTFTAVSTVNATPSTPAPSCTSTSANDDVWYQFVATSTRAVLYYNSFVASGGPSTGLGYAVTKTCPTSSTAADPNNLFCTFGFGSAASGGAQALTPALLVIGETYYLRVFAQGDQSFATFNLAIAQGPANDDCADAISVTPSAANTCTFFAVNTTAATKASQATSCAQTSSNDDVWYSFVAPSGNLNFQYESLVATTGSATQVGYTLYDGCSGSQIACVSGFGNGGSGFRFLDPSVPLTVNNTYYLRVYAQGGANSATFNFCIAAVDLPEIAVRPTNACVTSTVTLDGTGGRRPALDASGRVIAFVGNTEPLGVTTVSLYGNSGALRQYGAANTRYLDRNITITPTIQPTTPVTIGFPSTNAEINTFYAANGSTIFASYQLVKRSSTSCSSTFDGSAVAQPFSFVALYPGGFLFETSVTSFSEFFMTPVSAPLPVTLTRFSARADGSRNVIEWAAAAEVDLATYTVERATDAAATHFTSVSSVAPQGTASGIEAIYSATDETPARTSYYRLKTVDLDGSVDYSEVVAVTRTPAGGRTPGIKVYPNPSRSGSVATMTLADINELAGINIAITDAAGREVSRVRYKTSGTYELPVASLPAGVYTITAVTSTAVQTQRLIIE